MSELLFLDPTSNQQITSENDEAKRFRNRAQAILAKGTPLGQFINNLYLSDQISVDDRDQLLIWMDKVDSLFHTISVDAVEIIQNQITECGYDYIETAQKNYWKRMSDEGRKFWGKYNLDQFMTIVCKNWPLEHHTVVGINPEIDKQVKANLKYQYAEEMDDFVLAMHVCFHIAKTQLELNQEAKLLGEIGGKVRVTEL